MSANFVPPIPIGQFKPSSEAIASWLYEIWKYLQENPIPTPTSITGEMEQVAQTYVATNVPPMISQAISNLSYNDLVTGTSLPIYRASNDEIGPQDLLEAWDDGCRFALVDDEAFYIMIKNGDTVSLLQLLTEEQATGVISVNGQTGVVVIPAATQQAQGLMSSTDKTLLDSMQMTAVKCTVNSGYIVDSESNNGLFVSKQGKIVIINGFILPTQSPPAYTNIFYVPQGYRPNTAIAVNALSSGGSGIGNKWLIIDDSGNGQTQETFPQDNYYFISASWVIE